MLSRWRARRNRRRADSDARYAELRASAFGILERLAEPMVGQGAAALTEDKDEDAIELLPANPRSAKIWLAPGPNFHSLCVGPNGNLHEVVVGRGRWRDNPWADELEDCIRAVLEGRYSEEVADDGTHLRMVFRILDKEDIVVGHHAITMPSDASNPYGDPGIHEYEAYL